MSSWSTALLLLLCFLASEGAVRNQWALGPCILQIDEPCYLNERIKFYLHTPGLEGWRTLDLKNPGPPAGHDPTLPLKVIVHGYGGAHDTFVGPIIKEYLSEGTASVLAVDWSSLAQLPCYPWAALSSWQAGKCLGLALARLPSPHTHAIGFSLGAHVAAFASNFRLRHFNSTLDRITGLDPALPFFATSKTSLKLDPSDAQFVDVIHTNCGILGKLEPSGHADFYVNSITIQPMCANQTNPPLCSHVMSVKYFAESIRSKVGFWGRACPSFLTFAFRRCPDRPDRFIMGERASNRTRGIFIVMTNNEAPYARLDNYGINESLNVHSNSPEDLVRGVSKTQVKLKPGRSPRSKMKK